MNKKGKVSLIIIAIIIAIAVFLFFTFKGDQVPEYGEMINGYWDEATQECRSAPDRPLGVPYVPGQITTTMYQCCFNLEGQQVDCNNPTLLWGAGFAIYQGQPGLFGIVHGVTISNNIGNVDLINAWIESATWSPVHAELSNGWAGAIGPAKGSSLLITQFVDISGFTQIDLQAIGGEPGSPKTYTLLLVTKASATGLPDSSKTTPASITVEKEAIGFSVQINLGA